MKNCNTTKHVMPMMQVCITSTDWHFYNQDSICYKTVTSKIPPSDLSQAHYYTTQPHTEEIYGNIIECYPDGGHCNICEEIRSLCPAASI